MKTIFEKLALCTTEGEVRRMLDGNQCVVLPKQPVDISTSRYGDFEQVNGAVVNKALDTLEQKRKELFDTREELKRVRNWAEQVDAANTDLAVIIGRRPLNP